MNNKRRAATLAAQLLIGLILTGCGFAQIAKPILEPIDRGDCPAEYYDYETDTCVWPTLDIDDFVIRNVPTTFLVEPISNDIVVIEWAGSISMTNAYSVTTIITGPVTLRFPTKKEEVP